jgi:hypothetical protein
VDVAPRIDEAHGPLDHALDLFADAHHRLIGVARRLAEGLGEVGPVRRRLERIPAREHPPRHEGIALGRHVPHGLGDRDDLSPHLHQLIERRLHALGPPEALDLDNHLVHQGQGLLRAFTASHKFLETTRDGNELLAFLGRLPSQLAHLLGEVFDRFPRPLQEQFEIPLQRFLVQLF